MKRFFKSFFRIFERKKSPEEIIAGFGEKLSKNRYPVKFAEKNPELTAKFISALSQKYGIDLSSAQSAFNSLLERVEAGHPFPNDVWIERLIERQQKEKQSIERQKKVIERAGILGKKEERIEQIKNKLIQQFSLSEENAELLAEEIFLHPLEHEGKQLTNNEIAEKARELKGKEK